MKSSSLALHLLALISLLATLDTVGQATASVTETVSAAARATTEATTTAQSPSLRAPHRATLPTRVMSTERRTMATSRQRQPVARSTIASAAHAATSPKQVDKTIDRKVNPNSVRPLRSVGARNSGARQNRSLQTAVSSSPSSSSASPSYLAPTAATEARNGSTATTAVSKQRRHHFRTNQYSSSHEPTTPKTQRLLRTTTSEASHRRSKEPSMPLEDVDAADVVASEHDSLTNRNATQQRQAPKTSRMIHRLVAGHLQNSEGSSSYQVSAVSGNNTILQSKINPQAKIELVQTGNKATKPTKTSAKYSVAATSSTTTVKPVKLQTLLDLTDSTDDGREDDEALLEDAEDFDNWDNGILRLSAGSGKEKFKKKSKIDDSKKTLADQVRDGKYGLIEKELFRREPKRPGILSYLPNKEVPIDNEYNLGGLQEDDIWLAEDHLLVLKGGSLNEGRPHEEPWPPIDDYDSPGRQIKIPPNPKVPPPFPVQLEENGPIQFIGNSKFTVVYPIANESIPIYTAGPEADATPSENDSDNEKNSIARPGTPQDTAGGGGGEPHYVYPAPYPSWLFNNQTFVNPLLSNARPITFTGLGPFPFGRNGSLESFNGTDFLDEDDPTLYYPPAYSFVYKNNYTNLVPPGPLVPGIVLPPPANQFSRVEKPERPTSAPVIRQRIPSTTTSTTTTTTTTSAPAIEPPFRAVVTKISEYTPKIINITPSTPTVSTSIPSTPVEKFVASQPASPRHQIRPNSLPSIEPVPVPVAIPIPVYPRRPYAGSRPGILKFVPTTQTPTKDTFSKSNPIYYEYFESKRQPVKSNVIDEFLATTVGPPPSAKPIKLYSNSKRPYKSHQTRLKQQRLPFNENIVYITPKPEVRYKARPLENFEHEVNALRETLRYYQNQQLHDNSIPRTPKVKPIYEFSFDASKNIERPVDGSINDFRPPADFDEEPFKPMVTYSPPMNDENSFSPMAYDKVDIEASQKLIAPPNQQDEQSRYQQTTTLQPNSKSAPYQAQQLQPVRLKKQRLSAKYLQEPFIGTSYDHQSQQQTDVSQRPWVAVQKVPLDNYRAQPEEQYQYPVPKSRAYPSYYYGPPRPPVQNRQNNRFYDEPFQQPVRKLINYRVRPNDNFHYQHQQHQQHKQQPQQQPQANYWSLENDTYVNYAPNRPPINPDAEFIDPYQIVPYDGQGRYPPPAVSHQSQYYATRRQQIPLHRDILVNYRQPLPSINPDSEFIGHPQVFRNRPNQIYRSDSYRSLPQPLFENDNEQQDNVFYVSPKYRRANSNNNNNSNNKSNDNDNKQVREERNTNRNSNENVNRDINNGK